MPFPSRTLKWKWMRTSTFAPLVLPRPVRWTVATTFSPSPRTSSTSDLASSHASRPLGPGPHGSGDAAARGVVVLKGEPFECGRKHALPRVGVVIERPEQPAAEFLLTPRLVRGRLVSRHDQGGSWPIHGREQPFSSPRSPSL